MQAESGPYAFTYFKRFHKKPETKLTITRPKPENHTGREAHDRAEAILRETLDIDLWKALTIQQGDAIQQPALAKQTSLSAALDKVAGGRPADPREEGFLTEFGRNTPATTPSAVPNGKSFRNRARLKRAPRRKLPGSSRHIRDLEQDIDRAATLQRELGQLKRQEEELGKAVAAHTASLEEIGALESALSAARLKMESAQKSEQMARRDKEDAPRTH